MKAHALADADGMSGDEARAAARRRIGNPLRLREQSREPWIFPTVETFAQDVRHALRLMRRALASAAVSRFRSPGHRFVSAGDGEGRQDVLNLAARDLRGAAPARHHA